MKFLLALCLLAAAATAVPVSGDPKDATILRQEFNNIGVDAYSYAVETSDGKSAQEQGQLKNAGTENEAIEVRGQFSYQGDDGQIYTITYIADENGFQPQGAHLPKVA